MPLDPRWSCLNEYAAFDTGNAYSQMEGSGLLPVRHRLTSGVGLEVDRHSHATAFVDHKLIQGLRDVLSFQKKLRQALDDYRIVKSPGAEAADQLFRLPQRGDRGNAIADWSEAIGLAKEIEKTSGKAGNQAFKEIIQAQDLAQFEMAEDLKKWGKFNAAKAAYTKSLLREAADMSHNIASQLSRMRHMEKPTRSELPALAALLRPTIIVEGEQSQQQIAFKRREAFKRFLSVGAIG